MELVKLMTYVLLVIQGMIVLSLGKSTTASIKETKDGDVSALGVLYRKARQSRCIRCYDDRYADDGRQYSYSRNYYGGASYGGASGGDGGYASGYGSSSRNGYDDRNWYYYPDRYESRPKYDDRYQDRYNSGRYDDRYPPRTYDRNDNRGYYDRNDWRATPDFRGYGYDSQDKYYDRHNEGYSRDRYDRNRGGYEGRYYDRDSYDRYPTKGGYDNKNYRPWDETYRGTSGFDNSGRGYYFAGTPNEQPTASHYRPMPPSSPGRPYLPNSQSPPRPLMPPNSSSASTPYAPSSSSGSPSGPPSHHYQYNNRPPRPNDDSKGGYAGGWGYVNDRDKPNDYSDRNKDTESPSYGGGRPRPLGGSYLHDRESNTPTAVNTASGDDKTEETPKNSTTSETDSNTSNGNKTN